MMTPATNELAIIRFSNDIDSSVVAPLTNDNTARMLSALKEAIDCGENTTLVFALGGIQFLHCEAMAAIVKLINKNGAILAQEFGRFLFTVVTAAGKVVSVIVIGGAKHLPKEFIELKDDSSETDDDHTTLNNKDESVDLLLQSSDEENNNGGSGSEDGDLFNPDALEEMVKKVQRVKLDDDSSDSFDDAVGLTQELY
jgi:hypothetical protein